MSRTSMEKLDDNDKHVEIAMNSKDSNVVAGEEACLALRKMIERRLVWKQDLTILPLLAISFFFSYVV